MRGLAFFSGGKDSVFAIMKARQNGVPVDYLLFNTHEFPDPNVHELNKQLVEAIANLIGLPLRVLHLEPGREYESLTKLFSELDVGVVTVGNINVKEQMEWYEHLCGETGATLYAPLWAGAGRSSFLTLMDQLESGLKAMICGILKSALPARFLGRVIDYDIAKSLASLIDPCGEGGEYHTLVLDAPIMSGRLLIDEFSTIESGDRLMLAVESFRVEDKR
ncbi:MAG: diphthine--ammonia ligase [Candidatus Methanosuratincola sp.]